MRMSGKSATIQRDSTKKRTAFSDMNAPHGVIERLPFMNFVWGAGIECSFIPHLNVDQFEWTQHNRCWKDDLRLAREELGIKSLRYAFPWHQIQPRRGEFNWDFCDERIAEMKRLGIDPLMDVMHFGTPTWLKQAV